MKHLKLFEEFYFYGKEEEEGTCPSCGCEECECGGEEGEENYMESPYESEPDEMTDMFGGEEEEIGMDEEMPDMGGEESGFRRIKPFSAMGEEEEEVPFEEEEDEEDIILPVERKFEAKKTKLKKPDFPDIDGDGDTKEPISKAAKDKKKAEPKSKSKGGKLSKAQEKLPEGLKKAIKAGIRD